MLIPAQPKPARRLAAVGSLLEAALRFVDRHAAFLLPLYVAGFVAAVAPYATIPLWFDELATYYVATSPTVEKFFDLIVHTDLNPPLGYLPVMAAHALFGHHPLVTRLPSLAAFLLAGLLVFWLVRRRLGGLFALVALTLLWSGQFLYYAVQARPYALLLLLFCVSLICWQRAMRSGALPRDYWALAASVSAMLLTHCFAPALVMPLVAGEAVRTWSTRRVDRKMWVSLLAPSVIVLMYVPLLLSERTTIVYPTVYRPSWGTFVDFYKTAVWDRGQLSALALVALVFLRRKRGSPPAAVFFAPHEVSFALTALFAPALIIAYALAVQMSFWNRYAVGACLGVSLLATFFIAYKTNRKLWAAGLFAVLTLADFCRTTVNWPFLTQSSAERAVSTAYRDVHPDWPLVAASGISFLAMDHWEPPAVVARLYYLTDYESAMRYTGGNSFESFPDLCKYFPIRAHVAKYREFIARHERFLVLGTPDVPQEWLLHKLRDDGAELRLIATLRTYYKSRHLYEVRSPRPAAR